MSTTGRPRWYKPDRVLGFRMVLTMFLLGLVYVVFGAVLWKIGVGLGFLIFFALIIAIVQLFFADKIALASMGARIVSEQEAPELHDMIGRLAAATNLPKPKVAIVNSSIPNAFATGRDKNHAVVAVTTSIYQQLPPQELEAVLAHEMTHIINHDMLVMTIATFFSMVLALLMRNLFWIGMFGGFGGGGGYGGGRRNNDEGAGFLLAILASVVTYVVSFILIRALSRYRELAADRGSALITGAPENLASALLRISNTMKNARIPQQDFRTAQAVNALFIVPALRGDSLAVLFSTHPSIDERVQRLQAMQQQMEQAKKL
ncbi:MAG TPA: zinc metalloprotease HtpX [Ktedonobacterales bacterium]|nr:zinc metalloprotease HtpX [Ktedonobacterales bacterium]